MRHSTGFTSFNIAVVGFRLRPMINEHLFVA